MKILNRGQLGIDFEVPSGTYSINGINSSKIIGVPYAITEIPKQAWEEILHHYSHIAEIKTGIIYADAKIENVEAYAKDMEGEKLPDAPLEEAEIDKKLAKGKSRKGE